MGESSWPDRHLLSSSGWGEGAGVGTHSSCPQTGQRPIITPVPDPPKRLGDGHLSTWRVFFPPPPHRSLGARKLHLGSTSTGGPSPRGDLKEDPNTDQG